MKKSILILCTGNSCRSQMAAGFLQTLDPELEVSSAGTAPAMVVNPNAVAVMNEIGIDISGNRPQSINRYTAMSFDYVITVCDHARENCPVFLGRVSHRLHLGFPDPAEAQGTPEEVMDAFRTVRDLIIGRFTSLYQIMKKDNVNAYY